MGQSLEEIKEKVKEVYPNAYSFKVRMISNDSFEINYQIRYNYWYLCAPQETELEAWSNTLSRIENNKK